MGKPPWLKWRGKPKDPMTVGLRHGFRSGLEKSNADHLTKHGIPVVFEQVILKYVVPEQTRRYTPDFELPNGVIVETKGRFLAVDRAKHLYVHLCHPTLDIRFVFSNPNTRLTPSKPNSKTYAEWCEMHGFTWAKKLIPIEWAKEPKRHDAGPIGPRTVAVPPQEANDAPHPARLAHKARRG